MDPPTEQLIRDYLNRVSVAARGRLSADERRAFLARTREFIEQNTRALGQTDPRDVLRLLTGLGDPAVLADRERDRLAAQRAGAGHDTAPAGPRAARSRRWRPARGKVASLLAATAAAVPPGEGGPVPEPADDVPLTGEIRIQTRPISARWRPGAPMTPKVPKPREPKPRERRPPRVHRPGLPRRFQRDIPRPRDGQPDPAADQPGTGTAGQGPAGSAPPLPADIGHRPGRPEWPSLTVSMPPPEGAVQGNGHGPGGRFNGEAGPSAPAIGDGQANGDAPVNGDGPDAGRAGEPAGSAAGGVGAAGSPPRGARIAWAGGVRSGAMRVAALRPGGTRSGAARSGASGAEPSGGESSGGAGPGGSAESPGVTQRGGAPGEDPAGGPRPGPGAPDGAFAPIGPTVAKAARVVAVRARRHPLEAVAVVLLGLGGLIFPPVWLIGAAVALVSKVWDFRDKWVGLAAPVILVIAGMAADVSLGGNQSSLLSYIKEAWVFGGHISRIAAVLGAVYLAWRSERGRRPRAVQPWHKPRRFG